jgi:tRNA modification GTPase
VPGTTRDLIEEQANFGGYTFVFCDCAGIQQSADKVENIGIELAKDRVPWADLVLLVVDANDAASGWKVVLNQIKNQAKKIWLVVNKIDLNPEAIGKILCESKVCAQNFYLSAKTKSGLEAMSAALVEEVRQSVSVDAAGMQIVTNERQRACLTKAKLALQTALLAMAQSLPAEIISAEVRGALQALDEIIGKTYSEDILGRIFSKFCIGK